MSRKLLAVSFLLCPALAIAQESVASATEVQQDPITAYNELVKARNVAIQKWQQNRVTKAAEAKKNNKPMPAIAMTPPTQKFIDQARDLAKQYAGEDSAIQFHGFVLKYGAGDADAVKMTVRTLTLDHSGSAAISEALPFLGSAVRVAKDGVMELFGEVIEYNDSSEAKANALIARGQLLLSMAKSDEDRKAAQADLERVPTVTKDADLIASAEEALFEIKYLQVGATAPEIVATDVDGVEFKLSDYRGKVVLLDFWGFW